MNEDVVSSGPPRLRIELGDKAKDSITGYSGTVVSIEYLLYETTQVRIQRAGSDKDGDIHYPTPFALPRVILVEKG